MRRPTNRAKSPIASVSCSAIMHIGVALALTLQAGSAMAQSSPALTLTNGFSGSVSGATATTLSSFDAASSTQNDVLFGRNAKGPYPLSWKNARQGTDTVVHNGTTLQRDVDYSIDLAAGTITFTLPLQSGDMARVSYRTDTLNAMRNYVPMSIPLQWDIWQSGQNALRFSALFRSTPAGVNAGAAYMALQFTGIKSATSPQVTITGSVQNTVNGSNSQDDGKISVQTTPIPTLSKLKVTTTLENRYDNNGLLRSRETLIDLPPLKNGQVLLSGGVKETSSAGKDLRTGVLNLTARPFTNFEFTGSAHLRDGTVSGDLPDPNAVDGYDGKLSLTAWKRFKITGNMTLNPEESDGIVNRVLKQGLGLQTDLGLVSLHGQYDLENDYLNARLNGTTNFGIDYRLTHWDTVTTGFRAANLYDKTLMGQFEYSLGFTHKLGALFDLSLTGTLVTSDPLTHLDPDRTELKAQAKFGLHY